MDKTKLYLAIACGVLALILIVVVILVVTSGGDPTIPAGGAAAAAAAAAEAARRQRNESRQQVETAKADTTKTAAEIAANKERADADAAQVRDEVASATDEKLKEEGERLFGSTKPEDKTDPGGT
jgi:uncharacterized membrane protein YdbT with pleckstrin-like domain